MKKLLYLVFPLSLLVACGGGPPAGSTGNADGGDGGDGGGDGGGLAPFPHDECGRAQGGFPKDIGQLCAAGSNKALCEMMPSNECSGFCLWDQADPTGDQAYCSMLCDAQKPGSCPVSFSCKKEDCMGDSVCVRTSMPPMPGPPYQIAKSVYPPGRDALASVADGSGSSYWLTSMGEVFLRSAQGSWSSLGTFASGNLAPNGMAMIGGAAYVVGGQTFKAGWLVRIDGSTPTKATAANNVVGVFGTPAGKPIVYIDAAQPSDEGFYRVAADLGVTRIPPAANPPTFQSLNPLDRFGFVARCRLADNSVALCVGTDGTDTRTIEYPVALHESQGSVVEVVRYAGLSPSDLWALSNPNTDGGKIMHFDGISWSTEQVAALDFGRIHALSPASVVAFNKTRLLHFDGGCWRDLIPEDYDPNGEYDGGLMVTLGTNLVGWLHNPDFVKLDLTGR